jgi:hypothetical protein
MPTYKNENSYPIGCDGVYFAVGATHSTLRILSDPRLTKISEEPYYNPVWRIHSISSAGIGDDKIVLLGSKTLEARVWKISGAILTVYPQSEDAQPCAILPVNYSASVKTYGGFCNQLVLKFSAAGSCEIVELYRVVPFIEFFEGGGTGGGTGGGDIVIETQSADVEGTSGELAMIPKGAVVYTDINGLLLLAKADNLTTSMATGLAKQNIDPGETGYINIDGILQLTAGEWNIVIEGAMSGLTPGANYFLSKDNAGKLTLIAPEDEGCFVVALGKALSTTHFHIEIENPIAI